MKKGIAVFASITAALLCGCVNVVVQCPCQQQHPQHQPPPMVRNGPGPMPGPHVMTPQPRTSTEPAAPGSVEHKLREHGKSWVRVPGGQLEPGCYVEDILKGRLDQPQGRGDIGQVVSVSKNESGRPCATVDFGRGFKAGIDQGELALLKIVPEHDKKKSRE